MTLEDFAGEIDDFLGREGSILAANFVQSRLKAAFDSGLHIDKLNELIERHARITPDQDAVGTACITLYKSDVTQWYIFQALPHSSTLSLTPAHCISIKLDPTPTTIWEYELTSQVANEVFDPTQRLTMTRMSVWQQGEIKTIDRWTRTYAIGHSVIPPIFLSIRTSDIHDYEWIFDRRSLRPLRQVCVKPGYANLRTILELLAAAGTSDSIPFLLPYTDHEHHFIRWDALGAIASLDPDQGRVLLQRALNDPHVEIRRAAGLSLKQFE